MALEGIIGVYINPVKLVLFAVPFLVGLYIFLAL